MASVYDIKPAFQNLLRPLCQKLARKGVTANQVTVAAIGLSCAWGGWALMDPESCLVWLALPLVLLSRMGLNALDGMLAREHHMKSPLGAVLNETGDVLSDAALYLPFALIPGVVGAVAVGNVVLAGISEMTGVMGSQLSGTRRYEGPMGKSDRAVIYSVAALIVGFGGEALWINMILAGVMAGLVWTIGNRGSKAIAKANEGR